MRDIIRYNRRFQRGGLFILNLVPCKFYILTSIQSDRIYSSITDVILKPFYFLTSLTLPPPPTPSILGPDAPSDF